MSTTWRQSRDRARCAHCQHWCYRVPVDCFDPDREPQHITTYMFFCEACALRWHARPGEYEEGKLHATGHLYSPQDMRDKVRSGDRFVSHRKVVA